MPLATRPLPRPLALLAAFAAVGAAEVSAQWTWTDQAELSFVSAAGNASATTFGFKNTLTAKGGPSGFALEFGGVRTESSQTTRVATGTPAAFTVTETETSEVTAEKYFAKARYDRTLSASAFAFLGSDWDRNTFSGIASRFAFVLGAGRQFADSEDYRLKSDLGLTYTMQDNVAEGDVDRFGGLRMTTNLMRRLTPSTVFESVLIVDENLQDTEDLRGDLTSSVSVAINDRFALKTSLQLLFDNLPSFVDVPLTGAPGTTVATPLGKLDSVLTVALVINVR